METKKKADKRVNASNRFMPNIGGPSFFKRRVHLEVVHSTILYTAPFWHKAMNIERHEEMLIAIQRKMLLRTT